MTAVFTDFPVLCVGAKWGGSDERLFTKLIPNVVDHGNFQALLKLQLGSAKRTLPLLGTVFQAGQTHGTDTRALELVRSNRTVANPALFGRVLAFYHREDSVFGLNSFLGNWFGHHFGNWLSHHFSHHFGNWFGHTKFNPLDHTLGSTC